MHEQFSVEKNCSFEKTVSRCGYSGTSECKGAVAKLADKGGSTAGLLKYAIASDKKDFIVATESGILHEMRKQCPEKNFIPAPPEDSTCACNECNFMRLNTMEKLYNTLKYEWPEVTVDEAIAQEAVKTYQEDAGNLGETGIMKIKSRLFHTFQSKGDFWDINKQFTLAE